MLSSFLPMKTEMLVVVLDTQMVELGVMTDTDFELE